MTPTAAWLRETRLRHSAPSGRPWSQEYVVDRINEWAEATGQVQDNGSPWRLYRPNYVGYEGTVEPTPWIARKLIDFWRAQGEPEPDLTPEPEPEPPLSLEERAVRAAEAQVLATREQTEAIRGSGLVAALTDALQAQAQALTDIRLELAQAARDAEEQREATAELLGRLSAQLRTLAGNGAESAATGSAL